MDSNLLHSIYGPQIGQLLELVWKDNNLRPIEDLQRQLLGYCRLKCDRADQVIFRYIQGNIAKSSTTQRLNESIRLFQILYKQHHAMPSSV